MEMKIKFWKLYKIVQNLNRKKKKNDGENISLELQYRIKLYIKWKHLKMKYCINLNNRLSNLFSSPYIFILM